MVIAYTLKKIILTHPENYGFLKLWSCYNEMMSSVTISIIMTYFQPMPSWRFSRCFSFKIWHYDSYHSWPIWIRWGILFAWSVTQYTCHQSLIDQDVSSQYLIWSISLTHLKINISTLVLNPFEGNCMFKLYRNAYMRLMLNVYQYPEIYSRNPHK